MRVILLSATLVLFLAAATEAAYEDGVVAFNRGDYSVAQKELLPEAATGDRRAQFLLGTIYLYGRGITADPAQAAVWYRVAAKQGMTAAQYSLALLYETGTGVSADPIQAFRWYSRASERLGAGPSRWMILRSRDRVAASLPPEDLELARAELEREAQEVKSGDSAEVPEAAAKKTMKSPSPQDVGPGRQLIVRVQKELTELGYDPGKIDGLAGKNTVAAIHRFQQEQGWAISGEVSEVLLSELLIVRRVMASATVVKPDEVRPEAIDAFIQSTTDSLNQRMQALDSVAKHVDSVEAASYGWTLLDRWESETKETLRKQVGSEQAEQFGKWDAGLVLGDIFGNFQRASQANRVYLLSLRELIVRNPYRFYAERGGPE